ncbi:3-isopropylmalate dehydratase large subunit [Phototrophicus methaneseepsis]|uniref:3-isopropylmalate dehydratase large subunit n=1 Tax=Phototrophicus methaneseepsis TaxID=2710758 RepID=A0A7S8E7A6_9CHLR|nr:3-isopropylmalate dehydratase large subunit [Phototrophicus methaneseepsis]QPC81649.1 3-isopropylmalate dehydratase large subunit [Phototrophicus methaneseepsis]
MSGLTFVEKALARAAGVAEAHAGDVLDVTPDLIFSHDNSAAIRRIFLETGFERIARPDRIAITLDHAAPAPTTQHAQNHAEIRAWVREQSIAHFFEVGRGICHQVISEEALILPGEVILGADSHSTHFGWLGAFGMGVGRTEMAALWATGQLWLQVPESMRITLTGQFQPGVTTKDLALYILGRWGADGGQYRALEFTGDAIRTLSLDQRASLPNMMAEFGAMSAYMHPDQAIFDYLASNQQRDYTPLYPDDDAIYSDDHTIDLSSLEPQIALPHNPDNVVTLSEVLGRPVQQAFIGTCTNGRYEDLAAAAEVLRGQHVVVRTIIIPASRDVLLRATETGVLQTLIEAGATINTPGCGPCMGNHLGIPAPEEATISTGNRNFRGRMGTRESDIYLANPAVVAASAITGQITAPQTILNNNANLQGASL